MTDFSLVTPFEPLNYLGEDREGIERLQSRFSLITELNPYMAQRPEAIAAMANLPITTFELAQNAAGMYAVETADTFRKQLEALSPSQARSLFEKMPAARQQALVAQGYQPPKREESDSFFSGVPIIGEAIDAVIPDVIENNVLGAGLSLVGKGLSVPLHAVGTVVGPVVDPVLDTLNFIGNFPGYVYRSVRQLDNPAQLIALVGGVAAAWGLAMTGVGAPAAGALLGSLTQIGLLGGAAIAGAGVAGIAADQIGTVFGGTNDWINAFATSWNGENVFERGAKQRADELLGDPRLVTLAREAALVDIDMNDLAYKFARQRGGSNNDMLRVVDEVAVKYGEQGTSGYRAAAGAMVNLMQDPVFREAVTTLQQGKISMGRDTADLFGLEPGSNSYNLVSGTVDGIAMFALDPTMMATEFYKAYRFAKVGLNLADANRVQNFVDIYEKVPRIKEGIDGVAAAVSRNDYHWVRQHMTQWKGAYEDMASFRRAALVENPNFVFDGPALVKWITDTDKFRSILKGNGTLRSTQGLILQGISPKYGFRSLGAKARAAIDGFNDNDWIKAFEAGQASGKSIDEIAAGLPDDLLKDLADRGMLTRPWETYSGDLATYNAGRRAAQVVDALHLPFVDRAARLIDNMTTMVPRKGHIELIGATADEEIVKFVELTRHMGVPSWQRRMMVQDFTGTGVDIGARSQVLASIIQDGMRAAGTDLLPRGRELREEFVQRLLHIYSPGINGERTLDGGLVARRGVWPNEMATAAMVPDLHAIRNAVRQNKLAELVGALDSNRKISVFTNRWWKPSVLLRLGFPLRAGGEELLSWVARGTSGNLVQEAGARGIARYEAWAAVEAKRLRSIGTTIELSNHEQAVLKHGPWGGWLGAVETILGHGKWQDPVHGAIDRAVRYRNRLMIDGMKREMWIDSTRRAIVGNAPVPTGIWKPSRHHLAARADSILYGKGSSWRRMALGGIADDELEAARVLWLTHSSTALADTSASNAGVDFGQGNNSVDYEDVLNDQGEFERLRVETYRGRFRATFRDASDNAHGDARHVHALHDNMSQWTRNPTARRAVASALVRFKLRTLSQNQLAEMLDVYRSKNIKGFGRMLVNEYLGPTRALDDVGGIGVYQAHHISRETAGVFVHTLERAVPEFGEFVAQYIDELGDTLHVGNFGDAARQYLAGRGIGLNDIDEPMLEGDVAVRAAKHIIDAEDEAFTLLGQLAYLSDEERAYAAAMLRTFDELDITSADVLRNVMPGGRVRGYEHVSWLPQYDEIVDEISRIAAEMVPFNEASTQARRTWQAARRIRPPGLGTGPLESGFESAVREERINIAGSRGRTGAFGVRRGPGGEWDAWHHLPDKTKRELLRQSLVVDDAATAHVGTPDILAESIAANLGMDDRMAAIEWYFDMAVKVAKERAATRLDEMAAAREAMAAARSARQPHAARLREAKRKLDRLLTKAEAAGDAPAVRMLRADAITGRNVPLPSTEFVNTGIGSQRLFVDTFDELTDDLQRALYAATMTGRNQRISGAFDGLPITGDAPERLDDALVQLFELPALTPLTRQLTAVEDLAKLADDPNLILRNRAVIADALAHRRSTNTPQTFLLDDPALARELDVASQRMWASMTGQTPQIANRVRVLVAPRNVLAGDEVFGMSPLTRRDDRGIRMWATDADRVADRLQPWPDELHDAAWDIARRQVEDIRYWHVERGRNGMRPRYVDRADFGPDAEGRLDRFLKERKARRAARGGEVVDERPETMDVPTERVPMVYTRDVNGDLIPLDENEIIEQYDVSLVDKKGDPITPRDPAYFEPTTPVMPHDGQLMWRSLGTMVEDVWDMEQGFWRTVPKHYIAPSAKKKVGIMEAVRMTRSRSSDIDLSRALPVAFEPSRRVIRKHSFENFTRTAFDDVISPMIDAIVRRPMMQHQFTMRYKQAKAMRAFLADDTELKALAALAGGAGMTRPSRQFIDDMRLIAFHYEGARLPEGVPAEEWVDPLRWTDAEVLAWVRGHDAEQLATVFKAPDALASQLISEASVRQTIRARAEEQLSAARRDKFHYIEERADRPVRIAIAGDRGWTDPEVLELAMLQASQRYNGNVTFVIGDSRGAQRMATDIANEWGWSVESHAADWRAHPRRAVYMRNQQMMQSGPDAVLAFKTDLVENLATGETEDMIRAALDRELPVVHFNGNSWRHVETRRQQKMRTRLPAEVDHEAITAEAVKLLEAGERVRSTPIAAARSFMHADASAADILAFVESRVPSEALSSMPELRRWRQTALSVEDDPWLAALTDGEWELISSAHLARVAQENELGELAAQGAIADMLPFIDSHEFRTQFSAWGKGMMPFFYAEENFMRRWAKVLTDGGPAVIRKMQLGYMGFRHSGVVHTDADGKDWFVYPGSGLMTDAIRQLFPSVDLGSVFATPTGSLLPGLTGDTSRLGVPSFAPAVTVPLTQLTAWIPELKQAKFAMMGESSFDVTAFEQLFPTTLRNLARATFANDGEEQFASAMMAAISALEANEATALPENADARQRQEYMDRVKNHARTMMVARALGGFLGFSTVTTMNAGDTDSPLSISTSDPRDFLSAEYHKLIRMLGVNEGTMQFLELHPDATPESLLAQTVGMSESVTGAPLPSTQVAIDFYDDNNDFFSEYPAGAPWLLPYGDANASTRSRYAFDHQVATGLRQRRTPDEYLDAVKFKMASGPYFDYKEQYDAAIDKARLERNATEVSRLNAAWQMWATAYKEQHPIFAQELETGNGALRRQKVLSDLRSIIDDPLRPGAGEQGSQTEIIGTMMRAYDAYRINLVDLRADRSTRGRLAVEDYKKQWAAWGEQYALTYPQAAAFWQAVVRPESQLD